jgi:hypothetical protein
MANDVTGNPWILDTAELVFNGQVRVMKMVFYAGTANDDLAVSNGRGKSIWKVRAAAAATNYEDYAGIPMDFSESLIVEDFTITTIDGGELWVWIK